MIKENMKEPEETLMHHFFAYLSRMRYINRWNIMRNTYQENIQEHSLQVAMIAQALCKIKNKYYGGRLDEKRVLELAVYHEAAEVITGDLATPIKYFNPEIKDAYKQVEVVASKKLLKLLPEDLRPDYTQLLLPDEDTPEWAIVKAADKLSAYIKCLEELKMSNMEFEKAKESIECGLKALNSPEVDYFMEHFIPSFLLTLDELN
jgi:5'-deoxynucleotidase